MRKRVTTWSELAKFEPLRWPKKGDRLLRKATVYGKTDVDFAQTAMSRHVHIWDGFFKAGDGLIQLCTRDGYEHERHFVIYPILFNYRHGLELAMKWTIIQYGSEKLEDIEHHNLLSLWRKCKEIIDRYPSSDKDTPKYVEQVVKDFHDLDKKGDAFRYGWGKGGTEIRLPSFPVDLPNIRDVMEGISAFFDGLDAWLDDFKKSGY